MNNDFEQDVIKWMARVEQQLEPIPRISNSVQEILKKQAINKFITDNIIDRIEKIEEEQDKNQEYRISSKGIIKFVVLVVGWALAFLAIIYKA